MQAPCHLCSFAAGLSLALLFLSGCGTTPQPERPIQQEAKHASLPEAKAEAQLAQTSTTIHQNAVVEIDEKNTIFFSLGSSTLSQSEKDKLHLAAKSLKGDKGLFVTLVGRANGNGSRSFNLAVADARVESVVISLKRLGVKAYQIRKAVIGGEKAPSTCRSIECRRKMRHVELVFSTTK